MEPISDAQQLLTTGGVAAALYVFMELFVKPWMRKRYEAGPDGKVPAEHLDTYNALMNTSAGLFGILFAVLAAIAYPPEEGLTLAVFLTAGLVGIGGAILAVGTHNIATNFNKRFLEQ